MAFPFMGSDLLLMKWFSLKKWCIIISARRVRNCTRFRLAMLSDHSFLNENPRICNHTGHCRCSHGVRRSKVDLRLLGSHSSRVVPVSRGDTDFVAVQPAEGICRAAKACCARCVSNVATCFPENFNQWYAGDGFRLEAPGNFCCGRHDVSVQLHFIALNDFSGCDKVRKFSTGTRTDIGPV